MIFKIIAIKLNCNDDSSLSIHNSMKFTGNHATSTQVSSLTKDGKFVLSELWQQTGGKSIIDISSQIGCPVGCHLFCFVPALKRNLTSSEIIDQIPLVLKSVGRNVENFKVSYTKEGEPMLNNDLLKSIRLISNKYINKFKISTSLPDSTVVKRNLSELAEFAGGYHESIQIQISMSSTDEDFRRKATKIRLLSIEDIAKFGELWSKTTSINPVYRKINLSFTIDENTPMDPAKIISVISPKLFNMRIRDIFKLTEFPHDRSLSSNRFESIKSNFEKSGYTVLDGRIHPLTYNHALPIGHYGIYNMLQPPNPG